MMASAIWSGGGMVFCGGGGGGRVEVVVDDPFEDRAGLSWLYVMIGQNLTEAPRSIGNGVPACDRSPAGRSPLLESP